MSYSTQDNPKFCDFQGCGRKHYANGLCNTHDQQRQRGLELRPIRTYTATGSRDKTPCAFDPCDKPSRVGGLCSGHRNQKDKGQELRPLRPRRANGTETRCTFDGCTNMTTGGAFELCRGHYRQQRLGRGLEPLPDRKDSSARDSDGRKCCASCGEWKTEDSYHTDSHRADKLNSRCKRCIRSQMLVNTYGVTADHYDRMLKEQGGGCAVCGAVQSVDGSSLAVDHDHACCTGSKSCGGCVRGLLCRACNQGLGCFRDRPDLLASAAKYLNNSS